MVLFNISVLVDDQAILPETNPFLSAQIALMNTFFQMFIVLGMYEFSYEPKPKATALLVTGNTTVCNRRLMSA